MYLNDVYACSFRRIFMSHQRKGGIHEIYRYDMDTFGNFLVSRTGPLNILIAPAVYHGGFFLKFGGLS